MPVSASFRVKYRDISSSSLCLKDTGEVMPTPCSSDNYSSS